MNKDYGSLIKDKKAWDNFLAQELPTRKQEEYKYLDLDFLAKKDLRALDSSFDLDIKDIKHLLLEEKEFYNLVFINGRFTKSFSCYPKSLKINKIKNSSKEKHLLKNINRSFSLDILEFNFLENIDKPIAFVHINTIKDDQLEKRSVYTNYKILLAKKIKIEIFDKFVNFKNNDLLNNNVFEIYLNDNSRLDHYIHELSEDNLQFNHYQIDVNKSSEYRGFLVNQKSKISKFDFEINLNQSDAKAEIKGIYLAKNDQQLDHYIKTNHNHEKTYSNHYLKGVLDGASRGVFYASTIVQKDAKKIVAHQLNKNILLNKKAACFSRPELWINTDDVKCSHGSTTGQLDQEALFYLQTRGFSKEQATQMLLKAFIEEIFTLINKKMKKQFEKIFV